MPAGAQHWLYNDGDAPLVAVYVFDENNNINQLEPSMRKFLLAGGFSKGQPHFAENIFKGIDARFLSEALGVSMHVAEKLQSRRDQRGEIVRVEPEHGFHQLNPSPSSSSFSFPSSQVQYQTCQRDVDRHNVCAMEVRHSVERLDQADVYSPGTSTPTAPCTASGAVQGSRSPATTGPRCSTTCSVRGSCSSYPRATSSPPRRREKASSTSPSRRTLTPWSATSPGRTPS
ncbi:legumin1 [Zea mays]|uniref:Legumin1 n=1 Tax=Zea mays TaxID=4577 RepID=A0A1D6LI00_MAIZE|nr:legumin1 [Zea mays]